MNTRVSTSLVMPNEKPWAALSFDQMSLSASGARARVVNAFICIGEN